MDRLVQVSVERWNDDNAFQEQMKECPWQLWIISFLHSFRKILFEICKSITPNKENKLFVFQPHILTEFQQLYSLYSSPWLTCIYYTVIPLSLATAYHSERYESWDECYWMLFVFKRLGFPKQFFVWCSCIATYCATLNHHNTSSSLSNDWTKSLWISLCTAILPQFKFCQTFINFSFLYRLVWLMTE